MGILVKCISEATEHLRTADHMFIHVGLYVHFCYLILGCSTLVLSPSALQLSPQVGCMWLLAWKRYTTNTFWSMYRILGKGIPLNVGEYKFCSCGPLLQHLNSVNKTRKFTYFLWTSVSVDHFQAQVVAHISLDKLRKNTCEELMPIHVIVTALTQTVLVNSYTHIVLFLQQHETICTIH